MDHRDIREMTVMWRHYRYLRNNPGLLPGMARRSRNTCPTCPSTTSRNIAWPADEQYLQTGDIIAITSRDTGGYTSHVGLAYRDANGTLRFLHASSKQRRVLVDDRLVRLPRR